MSIRCHSVLHAALRLPCSLAVLRLWIGFQERGSEKINKQQQAAVATSGLKAPPPSGARPPRPPKGNEPVGTPSPGPGCSCTVLKRVARKVLPEIGRNRGCCMYKADSGHIVNFRHNFWSNEIGRPYKPSSTSTFHEWSRWARRAMREKRESNQDTAAGQALKSPEVQAKGSGLGGEGAGKLRPACCLACRKTASFYNYIATVPSPMPRRKPRYPSLSLGLPQALRASPAGVEALRREGLARLRDHGILSHLAILALVPTYEYCIKTDGKDKE